MDNYLFGIVYDNTPKFNKTVAEGVAVREVQGAERHVDHLFKCAQESFPAGLRYEGSRRCTPKAEYMSVTRKRNNAQAFELARSDVFMCEYSFSLNGKLLDPQKMYLPFCGDAGEIHIRGSSFFIYPVLADKMISVGTNDLFIPFNRDKLTFERLSAHFKVDGKTETAYVYWSAIHHGLKKQVVDGAAVVPNDMKTPLFLYLFCKYGVRETFARLCKGPVVVNHEDAFKNVAKGQRVCTSTRYKPSSLKSNYYQPSDLAICIHEQDLTPTVCSLIATFFYVVDHFPERVTLEDLDDGRLWKIILGQIVFKNKNNLGKLLESIDVHLTSVEGYMDAMVREQLADDGVVAVDIYDLFLYIVQNFSNLIINSDISSMYGKRLTVLRYLLFDITKEISKLIFKLQSLPPNKITENDINNILQRWLKPDRILEISGAKHGEVGGVSYPGDNMMFKITSNVVLQGDATAGSGNKKSANLSDPAKFLHSSIVEAGSLTNQPKSEPTGRTRANPHVTLLPDGTIVQDPARVPLLTGLQSQISRK